MADGQAFVAYSIVKDRIRMLVTKKLTSTYSERGVNKTKRVEI